MSLHQCETTEKLFGKPYCINHEKDAAVEANKEADKYLPAYVPLDLIPLLEKDGWNVKGWNACKHVDVLEVKMEFKELPIKAYTRMGEMPWNEIAENPELRHPKVHAELLKVQWFVKQVSKPAAPIAGCLRDV